LAQNTTQIGSVCVERTYEIRGWVVDGHPSVSISIASNLIYNKELTEFASEVPHLENLIGLWVVAKDLALKERSLVLLENSKITEHVCLL